MQELDKLFKDFYKMRDKKQQTNKSINSINSNDNLLQHFLAFQLVFINSSNLFFKL